MSLGGPNEGFGLYVVVIDIVVESFLAAEAITAYVASEEWQLGEIHAGIEDLDSGKTISRQKGFQLA